MGAAHQNQRNFRDIGTNEQDDKHQGDHGQSLTGDVLELRLGDAAGHEEVYTHGRRDEADGKVDHNDDAEVQRRYAHARHDGQQDGNEDNDSRQRFHERADDEQKHVDEHQDDDLVLGEAQDGPGHSAGHVFDGHDVPEQGRHGHQHDNDGGSLAGLNARVDKALEIHFLIQEQAHNHSEFELNFTEKAAGVRRVVGDSSEVIGDYDLVLITGKDLEHVWEQNECRSKEIREITIQFSSDLFFKSFINKNQFDSIRRMLDKAQKGLCFPMSAILKIYPLLDTLASEKQGFYAVIKFMTILYELSLFEEEARTLSSSSFAKIDIHSDSRRVQKVQEYINAHYQEEIRLGQLAAMVGMTDVSFSRFFKLRTGKNLSDYIIDIRLGFASRLLVDSTMSIAEICYECGFNNLSNFNRIFKKKKACSPKEFRENYRKKKKLV